MFGSVVINWVDAAGNGPEEGSFFVDNGEPIHAWDGLSWIQVMILFMIGFLFL